MKEVLGLGPRSLQPLGLDMAFLWCVPMGVLGPSWMRNGVKQVEPHRMLLQDREMSGGGGGQVSMWQESLELGSVA